MDKTSISIYRGLKEKFDPNTHIGFYITTDTNELLIGNSSLGKTVISGEVPTDYPNYIKLVLNSGEQVYVKIPNVTETNPGFMTSEQLRNLNSTLEDTYAYGVEFDYDKLDPKLTRVGNMSLYKDLPIQSKIAGCISQGTSVQYYLDPDDWRWVKGTSHDFTNGTLKYTRTQTSEGSSWIHSNFTFTCDQFDTLRFENSYIRIKGENEFVAFIKSIDTAAKTATLVVRDNVIPVTEEGPATINKQIAKYTLGSVRNGYDGTVKIRIPEFYIKHIIRNGKQRVMISEQQVDSTWVKHPEMYIDAYSATILRTVPTGMGYLSTLPAGTAISVDNPKDYCRGYLNNSAKDANYVPEKKTGDSSLNMAVCNITRADARTAAGDSRLLFYNEYAHIYWLYVIEQANFNTTLESLDTEELTIPENDYIASPIIKYVKCSDIEYPDAATAGLSYSSTALSSCGTLDRLGNHSGYGAFDEDETSTIVKWRGFEAFNLPLIVDGVVFVHTPNDKSSTLYYTTDTTDNTDQTSGKTHIAVAKKSGWCTAFTFPDNEVLNAIGEVNDVGSDTRMCIRFSMPSALGTYMVSVNVGNRLGSQLAGALDSKDIARTFKTVSTL